jgi:hypothetical protein
MVAAEILTAPPPPMISKAIDSNVPSIAAAVAGTEKQKNSRLDEVRAKLAELATKPKKDKLGRPLLYNKLPGIFVTNLASTPRKTFKILQTTLWNVNVAYPHPSNRM